MHVEAISNLVSWVGPAMVKSTGRGLMTMYFMFAYSPTLALIAIVGMLAVQLLFLGTIRVYERDMHRVQLKLNTLSDECGCL